MTRTVRVAIAGSLLCTLLAIGGCAANGTTGGGPLSDGAGITECPDGWLHLWGADDGTGLTPIATSDLPTKFSFLAPLLVDGCILQNDLSNGDYIAFTYEAPTLPGTTMDSVRELGASQGWAALSETEFAWQESGYQGGMAFRSAENMADLGIPDGTVVINFRYWPYTG